MDAMGEDLDPFGRRKDENPLASLGWHGDETASTAEPLAEPAGPPEPEPQTWKTPPRSPEREHEHEQREAEGEPPTASPRERPTATASAGESFPEAERIAAALRTQLRARVRSRGPGRLVRGVIILVVLFAVFGGIISTLVDEGVDRADRFIREFETPGVQAPAVPGADDESPSGREQATLPARGLSVTSLLRPAAFRKAMTRLRTGGYGRLMNLRVAPDRIDASMLTKDGRIRQVQITPGNAARILATSPSGFGGARTMTLKGIDTNAPSRLTRSAAGRLEQPASRVDYLVLTEFGGARQWNVYFKGGQIFSADAAGRITRRVS